jgi:hypothetical protein
MMTEQELERRILSGHLDHRDLRIKRKLVLQWVLKGHTVHWIPALGIYWRALLNTVMAFGE